MACLRVHHAMEELPARENAGAHACTDGEVHHIGKPLRAAEGDLAQARDVHIGVVSARNAEGSLQIAQQVKIAPRGLGRFENLAVTRRRGVHRGGAERANAQRSDALVLEPSSARCGCFLRGGGGERLGLDDGAVGIARGAYHLGAAGFQRAEQDLIHHRAPFSQITLPFQLL